MTKSLPGMCGKPRKLTTLLKRSWHVWNCLSQPAVTVKLSPAATSSGIACQSSKVTMVFLRCALTSTLRPALAPLVNVSFPAVNQPSSKPSSPLAVKAGSRDIKLAAGIAKIGRAGHGIKPPAILGQLLAEPADFGRECCALAANLAESALRQEHAQIGLRPIGEPQLDDRRIVTASGKIRLVKCIVGKRAGNLGTIDGEAELLRRFAA